MCEIWEISFEVWFKYCKFCYSHTFSIQKLDSLVYHTVTLFQKPHGFVKMGMQKPKN